LGYFHATPLLARLLHDFNPVSTWDFEIGLTRVYINYGLAMLLLFVMLYITTLICFASFPAVQSISTLFFCLA